MSLKLEESQKNFQIQQDETNKLTKQVDQLQEESSRMKVKFEYIGYYRCNLMSFSWGGWEELLHYLQWTVQNIEEEWITTFHYVKQAKI